MQSTEVYFVLLVILVICAAENTSSETGYHFEFFMNATIAVCPEATCRDSCFQARPYDASCFCDDICELYGDCCYDYWPVCRNQTFSLVSQGDFIRGKFICRVMSSGDCDHGLKIVAGCPDGYNRTDIQSKCADGLLPYRFPVLGQTGYLYANKYCAYCNGEMYENLEPFEISVTCPANMANSMANLTEDNVSQWFIMMIKCSYNATFPKKMEGKIRQCGGFEFIKNKCEFRADGAESTWISQAAQNYRGLVGYRNRYGEFVVSKNSHYATCNGIHITEDNISCHLHVSRTRRRREALECYPGRGGNRGPSFSALLDFGQQFGTSVIQSKDIARECPDSHTYEETSGTCTPVFCPNDYILDHGECVFSQNNEMHNDGLIVLEFKTAFTVSKKELQLIQSKTVERDLMEFYNTSGLWSGIFVEPSINTSIVGSVLLKMAIPKRTSTVREVIEEAWKFTLASTDFIRHRNPNFLVSVKMSFVEAVKEVIWNNTCEESATRGAFTIKKEEPDQGSRWKIEPPEVFISRYYADLVVPEDSLGSMSGNWTAYFCNIMIPTAKCSYVRISDNDIAESNATHLVLQDDRSFSKDSFYTSGNTTFVCSEYQTNYTEPAIFGMYIGDSLVDYYITIVGLSCSITGLSLTLFVYMLFPSLRNLPGRMLMNLSSSLLLAQFFFLFGASKIHWQTYCRVNAALEHYLWMTSFLWMNIISVDITKTFRTTSVIPQDDRAVFLITINAVYSWGLPLVQVGACIYLDLVDVVADTDLRYGSSTACLLSGFHGMVYGFVVPLAAIMVVNIVCYTFIFITLLQASLLSRKIKRTRMKRNHVLVYAKLIPITGLTWTFGILATFCQVDVLWIVFIILNSFQGLFIFFAFVFNRRVLLLFRERLFPSTSIKQTGSTSRPTPGTRF